MPANRQYLPSNVGLQCLEFLAHPAHAAPHHPSPLGQYVQRRQDLGGQNGGPKGQHDDGREQPDRWPNNSFMAQTVSHAGARED
jgi:hypothetical protein